MSPSKEQKEVGEVIRCYEPPGILVDLAQSRSGGGNGGRAGLKEGI